MYGKIKLSKLVLVFFCEALFTDSPALKYIYFNLVPKRRFSDLRKSTVFIHVVF